MVLPPAMRQREPANRLIKLSGAVGLGYFAAKAGSNPAVLQECSIGKTHSGCCPVINIQDAVGSVTSFSKRGGIAQLPCAARLSGSTPAPTRPAVRAAFCSCKKIRCRIACVTSFGCFVGFDSRKCSAQAGHCP